MRGLTIQMQIISSLILTVGSLFFIILLLVSYFSKTRFDSIKNKLYRYFLITVVILLITELFPPIYYYYGNSKYIYFLLVRIHWSTGIPWSLFLFLYSQCFLKNIKAENLKILLNENKLCRFYTIFTAIYSLGFFIFNFSDVSSMKSFTYIPGNAAYYTLVHCAITVLILILQTTFASKDIPLRKKITILVMLIELILIFSLQLKFINIAFIGLGSALQMYFLYFTIENPDISMQNELETVKSEIENSNRAKSDFLSNMSHEIRTPMNAIIGFSETLLNDPNFDEESAKNDIKHISSAGNSLLEIINNILDISKIESGSETLDKKEYSLASIIMELSSIIEARLENKSIKFIKNIDSEIPSKLYGDSVKLFQILLNILTNAAKYTEVGKIVFTVNKTIEGDYVKLNFKVADTGYGIKKEDYDKLFEKFARLETATTNEIEGTGLGLVITKKYVDLMDGKIWFESEYGVGTTFYVELKQKIIDRNPIGEIEKPVVTDNKVEHIDCSAYKVLIVDDNKLNLKVAQRILSEYKFNIETVDSGKDCVYKIKEGNHYDMIFLDHMMPEMDGIETFHILKKLVGYKIPPVVMLTANAITGMREMYLKEGFDEYLSKPINAIELNKIINKYFKK